jgi:hypothetical protein
MSIRGRYSADLAKTSVIKLPENEEWIRRIAAAAKFVVVSWGNPGHASGCGPVVEAIRREVCDPATILCFGKNKNGSPVHPLYQRLNAPLVPYVTPGRDRPNAPQDVVLARYEQCEDMATILAEQAQTLVFNENLSEGEVLARCYQGLLTDASTFSENKAHWVTCRLAELMGWELPCP